MSIVDVLEESRIKLHEVDLSQVRVTDQRNYRQVRGRIPEAMVAQWLAGCPEIERDTDVPRRVNGYRLEQRAYGSVMVHDSRTDRLIREFDGLIWYNGQPFVVEVKGGELKRRERRVRELLDMGRHVYDRRDVGLVVFMPFSASTEHSRRQLEQQFRRLWFVDLRYKGWMMGETMRDYRRLNQQGEEPAKYWRMYRQRG